MAAVRTWSNFDPKGLISEFLNTGNKYLLPLLKDSCNQDLQVSILSDLREALKSKNKKRIKRMLELILFQAEENEIPLLGAVFEKSFDRLQFKHLLIHLINLGKIKSKFNFDFSFGFFIKDKINKTFVGNRLFDVLLKEYKKGRRNKTTTDYRNIFLNSLRKGYKQGVITLETILKALQKGLDKKVFPKKKVLKCLQGAFELQTEITSLDHLKTNIIEQYKKNKKVADDELIKDFIKALEDYRQKTRISIGPQPQAELKVSLETKREMTQAEVESEKDSRVVGFRLDPNVSVLKEIFPVQLVFTYDFIQLESTHNTAVNVVRNVFTEPDSVENVARGLVEMESEKKLEDELRKLENELKKEKTHSEIEIKDTQYRNGFKYTKLGMPYFEPKTFLKLTEASATDSAAITPATKLEQEISSEQKNIPLKPDPLLPIPGMVVPPSIMQQQMMQQPMMQQPNHLTINASPGAYVVVYNMPPGYGPQVWGHGMIPREAARVPIMRVANPSHPWYEQNQRSRRSGLTPPERAFFSEIYKNHQREKYATTNAAAHAAAFPGPAI